jgi:hypothetical protein
MADFLAWVAVRERSERSLGTHGIVSRAREVAFDCEAEGEDAHGRGEEV